MGFSQALSGLNAASSSLDVLGNNIANSQTVGYKSSGAQFADIYAGSTGLGTQVSAVMQDFSDGNIENTGRNLDLAISGDGFYRFRQEGEVVYSRNGQLNMTADGYLENAQGARLMGYGLNADGRLQVGGQPDELQVPSDDMAAQATGTSTGDNPGVQATYNLDASIDETDASILNTAEVYTDADQTGTQELSYHYSNSFSVYDSLGTAHNVTAYFTKTAPNTWSVTTALDGVAGTTNAGALQDAAGNDLYSQGTLTFNTDGTLDTGSPIALDYGGETGGNTHITTGADDLGFDFNLAGTTQNSADSTNKSLTQDGYSSGALVGITIEDDGTVMRNYTNEQSAAAGQIALASFRNPEGLNAVGDNAWKATAASGQELVGVAGTGTLGTITSGAIETSNVDLASELVDMIVTQRAYQANSQTISTQDEVLQAAINLSR